MFERERGSPEDFPLEEAATVIGMLHAGLDPQRAYAAAGWGEPEDDGAPRGARAEFAVAARLAHATGAALASVMDACARAARDEAEAALIRDAALAGPRLSARVLAWLPAVGIGLAVLIDGGVLGVLASPVGAGLLTMGMGLTVIGRRWMKHLVLKASPGSEPVVLALHAVRAVMAAGADVANALAAVANAMEGEAVYASFAHRMRKVALAIHRGEAWSEAWSGCDLGPLERALRPAFDTGAHAGPMLIAVAEAETLRRRRQVQVAAGELAVRLTLPLALCLLPAFVIVGIVPLLVSLVGGLR